MKTLKGCLADCVGVVVVLVWLILPIQCAALDGLVMLIGLRWWLRKTNYE